MTSTWNNPEHYARYAFAYLEEHGEEGSTLEVQRWAEATFPEEFEEVL